MKRYIERMDVHFLPAVDSDFESIVAMMRDLYASENLPFNERALPALEALLNSKHLGHCEIITDLNTHIGYFVIGFGFSLEFGGRDAFLDELYIARSARNMGIGRLAVNRAIEVCRGLHIQSLHLEVSGKNIAAQRLYRGAGFTPRHSGYDLLTLRLD